MACLLASGSLALPWMMSDRRLVLSALIWPMMACSGTDASKEMVELGDTFEIVGERHAEMNVWILHLDDPSHFAGFLLAKSSGKLYFIMPLTWWNWRLSSAIHVRA